MLKGWSYLTDFILILGMSFSAGTPLLKAMGFAGKISQFNSRIQELSACSSNRPSSPVRRLLARMTEGIDT